MTSQLSDLLDKLGVEWILYLLLVLSVLSVAVIVERLLFLWQNRVPVGQIHDGLLVALAKGPTATEDMLKPYKGMEARVLAAGVREMHRGADAVAEVMTASVARERQRYERFLSFLASLGSNAPFIGLLGTVIGIMGAFSDLRRQVDTAATGARPAEALIMGSISEALVATAVGLFVAIPAVIAYNQFRTQIKKHQANTEALSSLLLAHLKTGK
jgi:biopolymer transport protein ExbB/TolQ